MVIASAVVIGFGILIVVLLYSSLFDFKPLIWVAHLLIPALKRRAEAEELRIKQEDAKIRAEEACAAFVYQVECEFGIHPAAAHEPESQDEIVRLVNLLGHQVAAACVDQDQERRESRQTHTHLTSQVQRLKKEWSSLRKLALQIAPELSGRLPHFSELEPLKSYNAEHLQKKLGRQST